VLPVLGILLLLFFIIDPIFKLTGFGKWIHSLFNVQILEIKTIPSGAVVYRDGNKMEGTTPFTLEELAPGNYRFELRYEGYPALAETIAINENAKIAKEFHFKKRFSFQSVPTGAKVFINGIGSEKVTPFDTILALENQMQFEMRMKGYKKLLMNCTFLSGENQIDIQQEPEWTFQKSGSETEPHIITGKFPIRVFIKTPLQQANIYLQNELIGISNKDTLELYPGNYELKFTKDNIAQSEKISIKENFDGRIFNKTYTLKDLDLNTQIEPRNSNLTVITEPLSSSVKIYERIPKKSDRLIHSEICKTSVTKKLKHGNYKIEVINPGGYAAGMEYVKFDRDISINIKLRILTVRLVLETTPSDAICFINGKRQIGGTPLSVELTETGEFKVLFQKVGYHDSEKIINITAGMRSPVVHHEPLKPFLVNITISLPKKCLIKIDGNWLDPSNKKKKWEIKGITVGMHELYVSYENGQSIGPKQWEVKYLDGYVYQEEDIK
jgi:hypothetical protein